MNTKGKLIAALQSAFVVATSICTTVCVDNAMKRKFGKDNLASNIVRPFLTATIDGVALIIADKLLDTAYYDDYDEEDECDCDQEESSKNPGSWYDALDDDARMDCDD